MPKLRAILRTAPNHQSRNEAKIVESKTRKAPSE